MSEGKKPGLLHFLQRLFGLGGDKLKPARPAPPAKKNRASHAPKRKLPGKGSAHKKPSSDKEPVLRPISPQRSSPPSPKSGTKPKAPPPAAPAEAPGEVPPHERPVADRQRRVPRGRPRLPLIPLPRPRSLRGRLIRARSWRRRLLALQQRQARHRPSTCLRQSARRESQAPKRRSPSEPVREGSFAMAVGATATQHETYSVW